MVLKGEQRESMDDLQDSVLQAILVATDAKLTATLRCISKRWRSAASDDVVWSHFCAQDFGVVSTVDPCGHQCSSFKETYEKWHATFCMYPLPIVKRAKHCWETITNWTATHFPEVGTLVHGASEEEIRNTEKSLGWQLPIPMKVLYRFCNGQYMMQYGFSRNEQLAVLGLLGGYRFYNHMVNVHLLPLDQILRFTKKWVPRGSKCAVVAASLAANKLFFLDCSDGQLYVDTRSDHFGNWDSDRLMPCVSRRLVNMAEQDAMLLWLEEYSKNLEAGMFSVRREGNIRSISLFPEKEPLCSKAITNGVQIRASAVFVPEASHLQVDNNQFCFCYSIRMHLLPQENVSLGKVLSSCQLSARHWIIRVNGNVVDEVRDAAVIGKYPLLKEGGDEFVYESCCYLPSSCGSIEGDFTFVPGRLSKPEGPEFIVQVALFPLQIPPYIF